MSVEITVIEQPIALTVVDGTTDIISIPSVSQINISLGEVASGIGIPPNGNDGEWLVKDGAVPYATKFTPRVAVVIGNDKEIPYNDGGVQNSDTYFKWNKNSRTLLIGIPDALPDNPLAIGDAINGWLQANIQNTNEGLIASSDWVATADNGSDLGNYIDMGIDSSIYASDDYPFYEPNDGYIQAEAPRIIINPSRAGSSIEFVTGGSELTDHRATIDASGLTVVAGHAIKIGSVNVALETNRPEIFYGTGSPPSATGLADGTMFFKYA